MYYGIALGGNLATTENSYCRLHAYIQQARPRRAARIKIKREFRAHFARLLKSLGVNLFRHAALPRAGKTRWSVDQSAPLEPCRRASRLISHTGYELGRALALMIIRCGGGQFAKLQHTRNPSASFVAARRFTTCPRAGVQAVPSARSRRFQRCSRRLPGPIQR
jgi:hypothetical protein